MITRNRRINNGSREIMFTLSFGLPDLKRLVKDILDYYYRQLDEDPDFDWKRDANRHQHTESELRECFAHPRASTSLLPAKMREAVAQWAFAQLLAQGFVSERVGQPGTYFFTEKAFQVMEKKQNDT